MIVGFRKLSVLALRILMVSGAAVAVLAWAGMLSSGSAPPATAGNAGTATVACLGYVDGEHGVAALDALRPGRVAAVLVKENQAVPARAVLVRLEDAPARARLEETQAGLELARTALEQARRRPQEHRLRLAQQAGAVKAAQDRLAAARQMALYRRRLAEKGLEAPEQLAATEAQLTELAALAQAEADRLGELELHDPSQDLRRAEAEVSLQSARVRQAAAELSELALRAPRAGRVLRILVGPGDVVGGPARKPVVYFCPDGPRFVRAEVEQEFAGNLQPGQAAVIRDDAGAGACRRGRVRRVADWFAPQRVVLEEPRPEREVRTVECIIEIEDRPCPLRIGQRVRVRIDVAPGGLH